MTPGTLGSEPAYPTPSAFPTAKGLTKREILAAMAMEALILKTPFEMLSKNAPGQLPQKVARGALDYADALLAELAK